MREIISTLIFIFVVGTLLWGGWYHRSADRVWDVVLMGMPTSLKPDDIEIESSGYLLNQTHIPLFKRDHDRQYTSSVLRKWSQDQSRKIIFLCPKAEIPLNRSVNFTTEMLVSFLIRRVPKTGLKARITNENNCAKLSFTNAQHDFFDVFSRFENSPSWKLDETSFESGLGAYGITAVSPDQIELSRKSYVSDGYNMISVHAYKSQEQFERLIQNEEIEDVNRVSADLVPLSLKTKYTDYGAVLLHTGVLILNVHDSSIRKRIYNCLDIKKFRAAFSPNFEHFKDVQTILPIGVPGALPGLAKQNCSNIVIPSHHVPVKFWNWKDNNREPIKAFWVEFEKTTGIRVQYSDIPLQKLVSIVDRSETGHELLVVGLNASEFHYRDFYQYLIDPKHTLLTHVKIDLARDLEVLDAKPSETQREALIKKIDAVLATQAVVLPLFQQIRHFYFPKQIRGFSFGSNFLEHPNIAALKN